MPVICRNRPNRTTPRKLTPDAAARIVCATLREPRVSPNIGNALLGGEIATATLAALAYARENPTYTQKDIEAALRERDCGWTTTEDQDPDCERKKREAVAIAQQLIQGNNRTLAVAEGALQVFEFAVRASLFAMKLIPVPAVRIIAVTLDRTAKPALARVRTTVRAQRAANDELFTLVSNL